MQQPLESLTNLLLSIGSAADRLPRAQVTGFLAVTGTCYSGELMVIGRSVNGWTDGIEPQRLSDQSTARSYAIQVQDSVAGNGRCPMIWVTDCWGEKDGYNTRSSAFWRTIRLVVGELCIADIEDRTWPSHLVWSNLYKVAPVGGGNPGQALCTAQLPSCISLLGEEIERFAPKRILLLTGMSWAEPFLASFTRRVSMASLGYVEALGRIHRQAGGETSIVVATHPQGKRQADWVTDVVNAFSVDRII